MTTAVIQLGRNLLVAVESVDLIRGNDKTFDQVTVEYSSGQNMKATILINPKYYDDVMAYCLQAINGAKLANNVKLQWNRLWDRTGAVSAQGAPEPKSSSPESSDDEDDDEENPEEKHAPLPAHIFVNNTVVLCRDDGVKRLLTISSLDAKRRRAEVEGGNCLGEIPFDMLHPIRANRNQEDPNWLHRKVLFQPHNHISTLVEGTVVGTMPHAQGVVIQHDGKFVVYPYSSVCLVL